MTSAINVFGNTSDALNVYQLSLLFMLQSIVLSAGSKFDRFDSDKEFVDPGMYTGL